MAKTLIAYFSHAGQNYSKGSIRDLPLITHGGSGFSNSLSDVRRLCPDVRITEGLAINGDDVQDCDRVFEKWLDKIGLK